MAKTRRKTLRAAAWTERPEAEVVLSCDDVGVRFGGLAALDEVAVEVRQGEIVGLIGPNGAGKTTLMECISGFQPVTARPRQLPR